MSYQCRFLDDPPKTSYDVEPPRYYADMCLLEIGDMFYARNYDWRFYTEPELRLMHLTEHYWTHNRQRGPLIVILPSKRMGKIYHNVDGQCYSKERGYYDGWTVSGTPPLITVSPSIHYPDDYHGFLTNGVISDPV